GGRQGEEEGRCQSRWQGAFLPVVELGAQVQLRGKSGIATGFIGFLLRQGESWLPGAAGPIAGGARAARWARCSTRARRACFRSSPAGPALQAAQERSTSPTGAI